MVQSYKLEELNYLLFNKLLVQYDVIRSIVVVHQEKCFAVFKSNQPKNCSADFFVYLKLIYTVFYCFIKIFALVLYFKCFNIKQTS